MILARDRERNVARKRDVLQVFGYVEVGFIERQRLDARRVLREDLADLLGDILVDLEAWLHENQVRALPLGRHRRHRRSDPELAGFVACGRDNATLTGTADGDRLAPELRIVPLLDGCIEGVHVDVDDLPLAGFVHRALVIFAAGPAP